jgi:hypothetical protein
MAQKVQILLEDDLDGKPADETVSFALDGTTYEIDLTKANAKKLRDAVAQYVGSARRVGRSGRAPARKAVSTGPDPKTVRAWANANGYEVPTRGRIPADVVEAFKAAGN